MSTKEIEEAVDRLVEQDRMSQMITEFRRVFGSVNQDQNGRVWADGWPDGVEYDVDVAIPVLQQFPDNYGRDERGDAEVCTALENAGAV